MRLKWGVLLVALAASAAVVPIHGATAAAPSTATPFDSQTVFCTKSTAPPGTRNSSSPGVTPNSIIVSDNSADADAYKRIGVTVLDFHRVWKIFFDEINKCGGINGRKIILKSALYNPTTPDLTGHLQTTCLKITEDQKAFFVVQSAAVSTIARCVGVQHKSIMEAAPPAGIAQVFQDSKGRVISVKPASDRQAKAFIADGVSQGIFKDKKIVVLGVALTPTSARELQEQFIDNFKRYGIDAGLEVLPCQGTVCTLNVGTAVRRIKASGANMVVINSNVLSATVGPFFREMNSQNVKATFAAPSAVTVMSDNTMGQNLAQGGADAMTYVDNQGYLALGDFVYGDWRTGKVLDTTFAKMCQNLYAKTLNQAPYPYNETNLVNSNWVIVATPCVSVRAFARALYSLGNNVTTERMVAALAKVKPDLTQTGPQGKDKMYYQWPNVDAQKVLTEKFFYPCPLPLPRPPGPARPCFMPLDSPVRYRTLKF